MDKIEPLPKAIDPTPAKVRPHTSEIHLFRNAINCHLSEISGQTYLRKCKGRCNQANTWIWNKVITSKLRNSLPKTRILINSCHMRERPSKRSAVLQKPSAKPLLSTISWQSGLLSRSNPEGDTLKTNMRKSEAKERTKNESRL